MKEKAVLEFFKAALEECQKVMEPIRSSSDALQDRYMCRRNWDGKQDFQFRIIPPYTKPKVKRAVNIIKSTLTKGPDYIDFDTPPRSPNDPMYQLDLQRCNYTKRLVKAHL